MAVMEKQMTMLEETNRETAEKPQIQVNKQPLAKVLLAYFVLTQFQI